jgi:exodeoxyribonuclease-3
LWGSVCYCQEVQEAIGKILKWGFEDVFRLLNPEPGHYTFWDYRVPNALNRKKGWRLDYIFATKPLAKKCVKCWIDVEARLKPMSSDHTFLMAEFDV